MIFNFGIVFSPGYVEKVYDYYAVFEMTFYDKGDSL